MLRIRDAHVTKPGKCGFPPIPFCNLIGYKFGMTGPVLSLVDRVGFVT
jgi:hypothetical protein